MAGTKFIWRDEATRPGLPSILVYEREVSLNENGAGYSVSDPKYLVTKLSPQQIIEWVESGTPLDGQASTE